jgi:hypothetical protein
MHTDHSTEAMEARNNAAIVDLSNQIDEITGIARGIRGELGSQNALIRALDDKFQAARSSLSGTMNRLGVLASQSNPRHLWALLGFVTFAIIFLWMFAR